MPRIAINGSGLDATLNDEIAEQLRLAGARPYRVLFDARPDLAPADALVLVGGDDIDPARYGAPRHPTHEPLELGREDFDFTLLEIALKAQLPILAICLGAQELWVKLGGALIQDIPSQCGSNVDHRARQGGNWVDLRVGSRLFRAFGRDQIRVYCNHHQGFADEPAPRNVIVTARSRDGLVEGFEMPSEERFVVAVGWHPERPPLGPELFTAFVRAAHDRPPSGLGSSP